MFALYAFGHFPLFTKMLPWHDIFALHNIFANAMKQRFLAMMICSEPFLFHLFFYYFISSSSTIIFSLSLSRS